MTTDPPTQDARLRWIWRGAAIAALAIGWLFIAWKNRFHVSAPMVFVCLGYLAVIATIYNLWRTGAAAVDPGEDNDSTWAKPVGALGELEREKRTLLKAIKEAEFDHQMGKLSQRDADEMIRGYRARAIEVIKEIDQLGQGGAGTVRDQILREVRARVELEARARKPAAESKVTKAARRAEKSGETASDKVAEKASGKAGEKAGGNAAEKAGDEAGDEAGTKAGEKARNLVAELMVGEAASYLARNDAASESAPASDDDAASNAATASEAAPARARIEAPSDDELDADSTTALEPRRDDSAKEATR